MSPPSIAPRSLSFTLNFGVLGRWSQVHRLPTDLQLNPVFLWEEAFLHNTAGIYLRNLPAIQKYLCLSLSAS